MLYQQTQTASSVLEQGFVHIHIGKTAGTSLLATLTSALGAEACSPPFAQSFMNEDDAIYYNSFPVIHGHISRHDQLKWFPNRQILTILRNPVERCFSFLRYVRSLPPSSSKVAADASKLSPLELMDTQEGRINLNNAMTRQLGGHLLSEETNYEDLFLAAQKTLIDAAWVGLQEDMPKSLEKLSKLIGLNLNSQFENITPRHFKNIENRNDVECKIIHFNYWDIKLFDWASHYLFDLEK